MAGTHAASLAGLRAMLTGLCGKSWRQKYLPSGDSYIRESTPSIGSRRVSSFLCRASPTIGNLYGLSAVIPLGLINTCKLERIKKSQSLVSACRSCSHKCYYNNIHIPNSIFRIIWMRVKNIRSFLLTIFK